MPRWLNLPNLVTFARLALAPVIIGDIMDGRPARALTLFLLAAFTDAIDGWLARISDSATQLGAYLDPIADKILMSGIFLALGAAQFVPWWFVAIVFGRDLYLLLAVAALMALTKIRKFPPSKWGKISTFVQIATAVTWMTRNLWPVQVLDSLAAAMLWVCAVFTIWSGLHYTFRALRTLRTIPGTH
jgi:cardiolipin synthase (CMP-forming)